MHRTIKTLKFIFTVSLVSFFLLSCSYLQKMKDRFQNRPKIEGAEVQDITSDNMNFNHQGSDSGNITGLSTVYFNLDSSVLTESVKNTLKANKAWLNKNPNVKRIILEGHCDPLGSEAYNIGLGEKRAQNVLNYLKSIGLSEDKISIVSYGEERLISSTNNSLNRRVNFVPQY